MWHGILAAAQGVAGSMPYLKRVIPPVFYKRVQDVITSKVVEKEVDRKYLVNTILPELASRNPARVLFVGCQYYTKRYKDFFPTSEFWTLDINPHNARWGSPLHRTGDVSELDKLFDAGYFDLVIINGVLGWGVDSDAAISKTLHAAAHILRARGIMLIGWNRGRCRDPLSFTAMHENFDHVEFGPIPRRMTFPTSTHIYDFFTSSVSPSYQPLARNS